MIFTNTSTEELLVELALNPKVDREAVARRLEEELELLEGGSSAAKEALEDLFEEVDNTRAEVDLWLDLNGTREHNAELAQDAVSHLRKIGKMLEAALPQDKVMEREDENRQ